MQQIQELVKQAQLISALMDDADFEVISLDVYNGVTRYLTRSDFFLKHFTGFEVKELDFGHYKFRLEKEIQGVTFCCHVKDLTGLKIIRLMQRNGVRLNRHKKGLQALACE